MASLDASRAEEWTVDAGRRGPGGRCDAAQYGDTTRAAAERVPPDAAESPAVTVRKSLEKEKRKKHKDEKRSIEDMIEDVFGRHTDAALRIAHCESTVRTPSATPAPSASSRSVPDCTRGA